MNKLYRLAGEMFSPPPRHDRIVDEFKVCQNRFVIRYNELECKYYALHYPPNKKNGRKIKYREEEGRTDFREYQTALRAIILYLNRFDLNITLGYGGFGP